MIALAKDMKPGDVHRLFDHVEHGKRSEKIAEVIEALTKSPGRDSERLIKRIVGADDRILSNSGGLTNPINEI